MEDVNIIEENQITEEKEIKEEVKPKTKKSKNRRRKSTSKIDPHELIPVMNFTVGTLFYSSPKTGFTLDLSGFGATDEVEFHELKTLRASSHKSILTNPWLLILDEETVKELRLEDIYENLFISLDEVKQLLKMPVDKFEEILNVLPPEGQKVVCKIAKQMYQKGTFDSIKKIKLLEETFGITIME